LDVLCAIRRLPISFVYPHNQMYAKSVLIIISIESFTCC
jgi:hypothetical protein